MKFNKLLKIAGSTALVFISQIPSLDSRAQSQQPTASNVSDEPEWQKAASGKMDFEVASIRPSQPGVMYESNISLTDDPHTALIGNLFRADAILMTYIAFAYKIVDSVQARSIWDKLPDWAKTDHFHIEARADGSPTRDQMRLLMQSLLADRFALKVHYETQSRQSYMFVLNERGKLGPQLRPHPANNPCVDSPGHLPVIPEPEDGTVPPRYCGMTAWNINGQRHIQIVDATMSEIAKYLSNVSLQGGATATPHLGVDGTGLDGRFDVDLQFIPLQPLNPDSDVSTFIAAVKKQLGFKLVEHKTPMSVLVLDSVAHPSPN
jgi:bla regulator protein blaR1